MGVMKCDREGCDNIMCQTMLHGKYLCYECEEEVYLLIKRLPDGQTEASFEDFVDNFFRERKGSNKTISTQDMLASIVRRSDD